MDIGFEWITRYGYAGIFLLLMLGIVGLPVPDETLLTFVGYLSFKGDLAFLPSVAAAFLGSSTGISLSYGIGRTAGSQAMTKLAPLLHLSAEHIANGQAWLRRWGKYALIIGYFVPGVRHLVALLAGASNLPLHIFAPFAYCDALLWSATFIAIGYVLGEEWNRQSSPAHRTVIILAVVVVFAILVGLLIIRRRGKAGPCDKVKKSEGNRLVLGLLASRPHNHERFSLLNDLGSRSGPSLMKRLLRCLDAGSYAIPSFAYAAIFVSFVAATWLTSYSIVHAYDPPPVPCDEAALAASRTESLGENEQRPIQHHWVFEANKRDGLFLKSPDDQFLLQVRGFLQLDYRSFPAGQEKGSPRIGEPGFFVQRARPTFLACVYRQIKIRLSPDFGNGVESPPQLFIANVEWDRFSYARLAYGLMKVPASLEVMQSIQSLPFMERSLVRNLVPLIAIGGTVSGQVWENKLDYQIGFWNDTPSGNFFEVGKVFTPPTTLTARVFLHPFSRHGSWLAGLGLGFGLTQGWIFDEAGLIPLQTETLSLTFFQLNPNVLGDGPRTRLLPQLSWYWKRAGFLAEYLYRSNRDKIVNGPSARFTDEAWSVQGSLFLTEDAASTGGVHPRRPFTVMRPGHWGAWQIALRHSELTLDQDIFSLGFADPLRNARHAESTTVALNWYLDSSLRLTAHYVHTDLAGAGPSYTGVRQEDGLMFRVQMTY